MTGDGEDRAFGSLTDPYSPDSLKLTPTQRLLNQGAHPKFYHGVNNFDRRIKDVLDDKITGFMDKTHARMRKQMDLLPVAVLVKRFHIPIDQGGSTVEYFITIKVYPDSKKDLLLAHRNVACHDGIMEFLFTSDPGLIDSSDPSKSLWFKKNQRTQEEFINTTLSSTGFTHTPELSTFMPETSILQQMYDEYTKIEPLVMTVPAGVKIKGLGDKEGCVIWSIGSLASGYTGTHLHSAVVDMDVGMDKAVSDAVAESFAKGELKSFTSSGSAVEYSQYSHAYDFTEFNSALRTASCPFINAPSCANTSYTEYPYGCGTGLWPHKGGCFNLSLRGCDSEYGKDNSTPAGFVSENCGEECNGTPCVDCPGMGCTGSCQGQGCSECAGEGCGGPGCEGQGCAHCPGQGCTPVPACQGQSCEVCSGSGCVPVPGWDCTGQNCSSCPGEGCVPDPDPCPGGDPVVTGPSRGVYESDLAFTVSCGGGGGGDPSASCVTFAFVSGSGSITSGGLMTGPANSGTGCKSTIASATCANGSTVNFQVDWHSAPTGLLAYYTNDIVRWECRYTGDPQYLTPGHDPGAGPGWGACCYNNYFHDCSGAVFNTTTNGPLYGLLPCTNLPSGGGPSAAQLLAGCGC